MQQLPELENSKLKDYIIGTAMSIHNCFNNDPKKPVNLYPGHVFFNIPENIVALNGGKHLVYRYKYDTMYSEIAKMELDRGPLMRSITELLDSNPDAFKEVLEKLFEDNSGNKTISIRVGYDSENKAVSYKITFPGDIQQAKIIRYIKDRLK
ncbi:MAG: hypothetical protein RL621_38 [Bacteroidota bacterium]|jgi:hypothetical protein